MPKTEEGERCTAPQSLDLLWEVTDADTWARVPGPAAEDGSIFAWLWRELVSEEAAPEPPPQPARPDLRALVCRACGAPASPHRYAHAVEITIPARQARP